MEVVPKTGNMEKVPIHSNVTAICVNLVKLAILVDSSSECTSKERCKESAGEGYVPPDHTCNGKLADCLGGRYSITFEDVCATVFLDFRAVSFTL